MSDRELVILGTASQAPTRERNHNGYFLRWDGEGILFDPGEGTQRQMIHAGVSAPSITRICITHFHGDHCLGLPGVIQRLSLDRVSHPVDVHFPASGEEYFQRMKNVAVYAERAVVRGHPTVPGEVVPGPPLRIVADHLHHRIETLGWRLEEPPGRRMLPAELEAAGVRGPAIGRLQEEGAIEVDGRRVALEETSEPRPGQVFAFLMDTGICDAAFELAEGADLLVCEATFLERDADLAERYTHLTARQAARIAARSGARHLVLTHFSQRYTDAAEFLREATEVFEEVTVAHDLMRVPVPARR